MERKLTQCADMIRSGLRRLSTVEERLAYGDFEAATEAIKFAWGAIVEPMGILSEYWDGAFWSDWQHRDAVYSNIVEARELLKDPETLCFERTLTDLKDLLDANLHLLRDAVDSLGADRGIFHRDQESALQQ